jgi:hypothetical protein
MAKDKSTEYVDSLRSLHAAMSDYLLLIGEPCPLLGQLCMRFIEMIGCLPPGDETYVDTLDKLTACILEAAILGVIDRLRQLRPQSMMCLQNMDSCMKVADDISVHDRYVVFFKVLGMGMAGLQELTNQEYPQLADGEGKRLGRKQ